VILLFDLDFNGSRDLYTADGIEPLPRLVGEAQRPLAAGSTATDGVFAAITGRGKVDVGEDSDDGELHVENRRLGNA
jgi:hypothetical protein